MAESGPLLGRVLDLDVGGPAAGGSCVARTDGRVVFVRHALPGERVRARVTEDRGGSFCRADAVEVLRPSPDRVTPPCPHAGPGRCGGCDWQHASGPAQRTLKTAVVRDQFTRLAGLDLATEVFAGVEELPGGLLGWRSRIAYAVDREGRPGLLRHGTHEVEQLDGCPLGVPGVGDAGLLAQRWPGLRAVEAVRGDDGVTSVVAHHPAGRARRGRGRRPPDRLEVVAGPPTVRRRVDGHDLAVSATGFWQVHPDAADTLVAAALDVLTPRPGERALDLYAGAGAITASLARAVGPAGTVTGLEGDRQAVADAAANLAGHPWAQVQHARVSAAAVAASGPADLVVLDPPRAGAGAEVVAAVAALHPRAVAYVSCDPATLARDVAVLCRLGWRLARLRGFDAFPMTHHVECVAALYPDPAGGAP